MKDKMFKDSAGNIIRGNGDSDITNIGMSEIKTDDKDFLKSFREKRIASLKIAVKEKIEKTYPIYKQINIMTEYNVYINVNEKESYDKHNKKIIKSKDLNYEELLKKCKGCPQEVFEFLFMKEFINRERQISKEKESLINSSNYSEILKIWLDY